MSELEQFVKVEMLRDVPLEDIVELLDKYEKDTKDKDYRYENLVNNSAKDIEEIRKLRKEKEQLEKENAELREALDNKYPRCCKCEISISEKSIICRSCENRGKG